MSMIRRALKGMATMNKGYNGVRNPRYYSQVLWQVRHALSSD